MTKTKTTERVKPLALKKEEVDPKIHLMKYFNSISFSDMQKAILNQFKNEMHTKKEWKKIADKEFKRKLT